MEIAVLGTVELRSGTGDSVPVAGARLRTLLLLLALDANRVVTAGRLIDGVWDDEPPQAAGNALQALVSRLRRTAPELTVEAAANGYRLVIDAENIDVNRFIKLAQDSPEEALKLWRGDLDFPEVARGDARRLEELRLNALRRKLAAQPDAVPELEGLVAQHPLDEPLAALLMRALRDQGNPGRALEVFETVRKRLADQLGTDPSPELAELHLDLLRAAPKGNLPAEVSSFVGRENDVKAVCALLANHRLVTLLGPGGNGKTRLSVEVGSRVPGEVWRVELAPVTDPAEVPHAVQTALRLRGQVLIGPTRPGPALSASERLAEALAGREMLLILDNCEHLIGAAAELADTLLRAAPGLRLLTTSREPLAIPGERLHPVEPLALPPVGADAATAMAFPAVRLLLDRAPATLLTSDNVEPVSRICRALDGMPLAIELAAARLRTLPVTVLADRLADRFRLLTGGSRTALPRHQTLRAVVDWSWDLLGEAERRLWRRFAMFHGGADVAAAEQVCDADPDLIGALVDKSLLVLGPDGRYRMLETIREYGLERLAEAGESESQRMALAGWLLALATAAEPRLRTADQLVWLRRISDEHDNFHASTRAAIDAGDKATAAAFVARLGWYWWLRGHRMEGAGLSAEVAAMTGEADREDVALTHTFASINGLEGALSIEAVQEHFRLAEASGAGPDAAHPALRLLRPLAAIFDNFDPESGFRAVEPLFEDPDPWLRASAKMIVGHLRLNFGYSGESVIAEMRDALAGFRSVGERWGIGFTLSALGDLVSADGDFAQGVRLQREAMALVREVGIREDLPQLEVKMAHQLYLAGEHDEARRVLKQSWEEAEEIGLPDVLASVQYGYATIARLEGDLEVAREMIGRSAEMLSNPSFAPQFGSMTRSTQGLIEAAAGNLELAGRYHAEAVRIAVDARDAPVIAMAVIGLADLAMRTGDPDRAAFLLGAADAVRGGRDRTVPDTERITFEARAALGDAGYETAYRRAAGITPAEVKDLLDPAAEGPDGQRSEGDEQDRRPDQ
ncbi:putative ATPase/DNA-binding SARP family transcriptional activator [Actinoplanes tereljensis]|uniref:SARP family transcriptional regulator n=1 Tax=Paractinoplanes tereljensis TaxID=571912 RepID=A0A919NMQ8_9ACTN|nr:BTAD domain-containing putative transcriptional regulator [Actinoplanes tereljensis]GIF21028.1 SARP family transcriptional regulator [Actinoplanes tereljensis]